MDNKVVGKADKTGFVDKGDKLSKDYKVCNRKRFFVDNQKNICCLRN
jgi:hypothetical protein